MEFFVSIKHILTKKKVDSYSQSQRCDFLVLSRIRIELNWTFRFCSGLNSDLVRFFFVLSCRIFEISTVSILTCCRKFEYYGIFGSSSDSIRFDLVLSWRKFEISTLGKINCPYSHLISVHQIFIRIRLSMYLFWLS